MPTQPSILIVDDHKDTLYALECALAPLGYHVTSASDGDAALKHVLRGNIGLLVLDVRMPGANDLDVVRYIRRLEQTQHIPVLLLTGFGPDGELTASAYELGVADLVPKPIDPFALRTKVRYLFDAHQRYQALEAEVRALRATPEEAAAPGRSRAGAGPDARVPAQRDAPLRADAPCPGDVAPGR